MGFLKKAFGFISRPTHSRTMGLLVVFALVIAVTFTVVSSQNQQTIKQRAAGTLSALNSNLSDCKGGLTCDALKNDEDTCPPAEHPTEQIRCLSSSFNYAGRTIPNRTIVCCAEPINPATPIPPSCEWKSGEETRAGTCKSSQEGCGTSDILYSPSSGCDESTPICCVPQTPRNETGVGSYNTTYKMITSATDRKYYENMESQIKVLAADYGQTGILTLSERNYLLKLYVEKGKNIPPASTPTNPSDLSCSVPDVGKGFCMNNKEITENCKTTSYKSDFRVVDWQECSNKTDGKKGFCCVGATSAPPATTVPAAATDACDLSKKEKLNERGDANCDDKVDASDYVEWLKEFTTGTKTANNSADFNGQDGVTIVDYNIYRDGFNDQALSH